MSSMGEDTDLDYEAATELEDWDDAVWDAALAEALETLRDESRDDWASDQEAKVEEAMEVDVY